MPPKLIYTAFDVVPAPKGAAIHIEAFSRALGAAFAPIELVTVAPGPGPQGPQELYPGVIQTALPALGKTLIQRVLHFRNNLDRWWHNQFFDVIQFRSIYEGFWIAQDLPRYGKHVIFEVNGLPSIELKYKYPQVEEDDELLRKLKAQEQVCLEAAHYVVTPSVVTQNYLISQGCDPQKIQVIPNGVDVELFTYQLPQPPVLPLRLVYFGVLAPWQGIELAIRALPLIRHVLPCELILIGPGQQRQVQQIEHLAHKLGVGSQVQWLGAMPQSALIQQLHQAHVMVAPLTLNDRNLVQGCCPLKVLEGMATGTPVISTDLAVVRALGQHGTHFWLVKPGSVVELAQAVIHLAQDRDLCAYLAHNARRHVEANYTWRQSGQSLVNLYQKML